MGASLGGFFHLTGWPDRPPCGPFGAYSDYPSPRFALCALLAALDHRRRTGEGQYLDFAQAEACVHFLSPAVLDQSVNGRAATRHGNADSRWCRTACTRAPATTRGSPSPAATTPTGRRSPRCSTATDLAGADDGRAARPREAELDDDRRRVDRRRAHPTRRWPRAIAAGVPAHAVQNSGECMADPQLDHLGHWVTLPHPDHGTIVVEGCRIALSRHARRRPRRPAVPRPGHRRVLLEDLGYDDERLGELYAANALD